MKDFAKIFVPCYPIWLYNSKRILQSVSRRLNKAILLFSSHFNARSIFKAPGTEVRLGSRLKPNHHNQVELVRIPDKNCGCVFLNR